MRPPARPRLPRSSRFQGEPRCPADGNARAAHCETLGLDAPGENPGARMAVELPAENPRDGKRRGIQSKRVTEHLDPADQIGAAVVAPAFEQGLSRSRALGAARKTLAAFGEHVEGRAYRA